MIIQDILNLEGTNKLTIVKCTTPTSFEIIFGPDPNTMGVDVPREVMRSRALKNGEIGYLICIYSHTHHWYWL